MPRLGIGLQTSAAALLFMASWLAEQFANMAACLESVQMLPTHTQNCERLLAPYIALSSSITISMIHHQVWSQHLNRSNQSILESR